ncbi:MAG TPA: hypothetical protein VIL88_02525 [Devosia sp.]|jgi:hypothetical protein|uniref:hypothetical protein n=1 Tax=Devosia sp. TaxID=1871048 RepID=UPI002F94B3ED
MADDAYIEYMTRQVDQFREQGRWVLGPDVSFMVRGARFDEDGIYLDYDVEPGPGKRGLVDLPDRRVLMELLARTYHVRSKWADRETGRDRRLPPESWDELVMRHFPVYRCGLAVGAGWGDLLMATADWIGEVDPYYPGFVDVKDKMGGLELAGPVSDVDIVDDIIASAEQLSEFICEVCGKPGWNRDGRTVCRDHE